MEIVETIFLVLAYIAAIGFLVSGLDDLFFDGQFLLYLWRQRKQPRLTLEEISLAPEQWVALFVPAWNEGGVVNKMAEYAARVVSYEKYDIFIGVYPNDPETNRCVDEICVANPRIHKVMVPHNGPTSKADCLNAIYRGMSLHEVAGVREYKVIALHDAEDVIHPLALKVYSYYVPARYDMAQLPVFALELPVWRYWSGNTYIDDFAELHTKDMFIRQSVGGVVPSAGVGTAFSRLALDKLAAENGGEPFRIGNLTEDYEVGIRTKRAGLRTGFVSQPIDRIVRPKRRDGTLGPPKVVTEIVAIRENFPTTFATAVRQRSRWILGISFQTWEQTGWAGTWPMRYTLLRDRRAPLTHIINMVGYVVLAYLILFWAFRQTPWATQFYVRPVFAGDSLLWKIVIIDTGLLVYRAVQKIISVAAIYNFKQALFSLPRTVLSNLINFAATMRALKMYLAHRVFGKPLAWLKTAHTFPAEAELSEYTRSIEDLLVQEGLATREQIFDALRQQQTGSAPLALMRLGLLQEKDFTAVWARHSGLPTRFVNPYVIPADLLKKFPENWSISDEAIPMERNNGRVVMAFREPPGSAELQQFKQLFNSDVQAVLAQPSHLAYARNRAYPRLVLAESNVPILPEKFKQSTAPDAAIFMEAISSQQSSRASLPDVMVDMGALSETDARRLWAEVLGLPASRFAEIAIDRDRYFRVGPFFWWLHRLLPAQDNTIIVLAGSRCHPGMMDWLAEKIGARPRFVAELPRKVDQAIRNADLEIDPDQMLLDTLADKGVLTAEAVNRVKSARTLITDPVVKWLRLQKLATDAQLHEAFLELCFLPRAENVNHDEVKRLVPLLAPGFAEEHGCYCLDEFGGAVRIGLVQMPSLAMIRQIYDRLSGCAVFFQTLGPEQTTQLRRIVAGGA